MLERLFKIPALHTYLHFFGVLILIVGLPLSKVLMSIGSIWIVANLLLEGQFKLYYQRLRKEPIIWLLTLLFLAHFIGLLWSDDLSYGWRDIKTKLPLFTIPLALFAQPIQKDFIYYLLKSFLATLLLTSCINVVNYFFYKDYWLTGDIRQLSLFGSHIRYGLLIIMGIILTIYLYRLKKLNSNVAFILVTWFLAYTFFAQALSAYIILFAVFLVFVCYFIRKTISSPILRLTVYSLCSLTTIVLITSLVNFIQPSTAPVDVESLPNYTSQNNPYLHLTDHELTENGHHVLLYICEAELRPAWNANSTIPYDSLNQRGQNLRSALFKYMTSKGLTKDAEGFKSMTLEDIRNVERGMSTIREQELFYLRRIEGLRTQLYNYRMGESPSGSTILQRFEHWRAGIAIIRNNWLIGVGTGDVQEAFNQQYEVMETALSPEHWNRTHNQFLTFWISFGLLGFLLFIGIIYLIIRHAWQTNSLPIFIFGLIVIVSCLFEDTLETQQGVTFVALFLSLLWNHRLDKSTAKTG